MGQRTRYVKIMKWSHWKSKKALLLCWFYYNLLKLSYYIGLGKCKGFRLAEETLKRRRVRDLTLPAAETEHLQWLRQHGIGIRIDEYINGAEEESPEIGSYAYTQTAGFLQNCNANSVDKGYGFFPHQMVLNYWLSICIRKEQNKKKNNSKWSLDLNIKQNQ